VSSFFVATDGGFLYLISVIFLGPEKPPKLEDFKSF
jgi:hypothetical protein